MDRVDRNPADAEILVEVLVGRHVPAAALHPHLHVQLAALGDGRDVRVRLENLDVGVDLDVAGAHFAGLVDPQRERLRVIDVQLQRNLLEVEDDVGGVLDHAGNRRELVQHAVDLHRGDRRAFDRRQQHAAQRVADGGAEAALERLRVEPAEAIGERLTFELEPLGPLKTFPEHRVSFRLRARRRASRPAYDRRPPAAGLTRLRVGGASALLRVQLDDELLLNRQVDLLTGRHRVDAAGERVRVERQPFGDAAALHFLHRVLDRRILLRATEDGNRVALFHRIRRDVDLLAVDHEVPVAHQLPRLRPRGRQAEAVDHVVEPPFEQLQQRDAGDAAGPLGRFEVAAELIFEHAVDALHLLLLAELQAVTGELRFPRLAVLSGREVALLDRALLRVAALALQEQLHRLAAAQPANRSDITSHSKPSSRQTHELTRTAAPKPTDSCLCGLGGHGVLDTATLRRPAAVVRNRRDVANRFHFQADGLQGANRRFAAGAGALDANVERAHADGLRRVAGVERRLRRRERRALARALEPDAAGARPGDDVALGVGDRHRGVVERGVDVREPVVDDALLAAFLERLLALAGAFLLLWCGALRRRVALGHKLDNLLLRDRALARTLARARVGARALAAHRQAAAMPHAAEAADFHQPLDVHRDLLAEIALDAALLLDHPADLAHVVLGQILDADVRRHAGVLEDAVRAHPPDAVDVGETDLDPLGSRKINACDTCHVCSLRPGGSGRPGGPGGSDIPALASSDLPDPPDPPDLPDLTLSLLVLLVRANHAYDPAAPHDLALVANPPDRCPDLHRLVPYLQLLD